MNSMLEKHVIKEEPKKKLKLAKPKKKLLLLDESEENLDQLNDDSIHFYTKRHLNLKNKLTETRFNAHSTNPNNFNNIEEDVFDDNNSSERLNKTISPHKSKTNDELKEVLDLMNDLRDEGINRSVCELNDCIELDDSNSVSDNTRSRKANKTQTKSKNSNKKNKKNNKKNNKKSLIDEQQMFDKLDVLECMDGIETLEDIEEIEVINSSIVVSEDVDQYMNSRSIEIKVKYKAVIEKFSMKQNEQFLSIMPSIAERYNEEVSNLILRLNDSIITAESTPQSIGLNVSDIIECHKRAINTDFQMDDPNQLTLKLRDSSKVTETIHVSKFDKISKIMDHYSKLKGLALTRFRLEFDGERLNPNQTVGDYDIDDDSQIDVINQ